MYSIPTYKVLVVGDSGTGKTSLVDRIITGSFESSPLPTVGVEFKAYTTMANGSQIKLTIWDTAGQEKYRSVAKSYFRNGCGALVVFSINSAESFDHCEQWIEDIHNGCLPNAVILLVGNKCDLESQRQVTSDEARTLAQRHGCVYMETSAFNNTNVQDAFVRLGQTIHESASKGLIQGVFAAPLAVIESTAPAKKSGGCC